jgi:hypothetical protein
MFRVLLLESPEPIEWRRVKLTIGHNTNALPISPVSGGIKISNVGFSKTGTDPDQEYVELIALEDVDLSGYTILYRSTSSKKIGLYYQFPRDIFIQEGTRVQIHSGAKSSTIPQDKEAVHRFVAPTKDKAKSHFKSGEVELQLISPQNQLIHEGSFSPSSNFNNIAYKIIRNADGTAAWLFISSSKQVTGPIAAGTYQLQFTYSRDIGKVYPLLKRNGSHNDEKASIQLSLRASKGAKSP